MALADLTTMVIQAEAWPTLLLELSLNPQRVVVESDKLTITAFSLLGLLWDAISIETRGQTAATISNLSKSNARRLKSVLQSLER